MIDFFKLKIKRTFLIFFVPMLVEIGFTFFTIYEKKDNDLYAYQSLWLIASLSILFVWIVGQILYEYYLNGDQLINILPFNKLLLVIGDSLIYTLFFTIYGIICQFGQYYSIDKKLVSLNNILNYSFNKFISVFALLMILIMVINIFKNISKPTFGIILIVIVTTFISILQFKYSWGFLDLPNKNFVVGIGNGDGLDFVNLNIITVGFVKRFIHHFEHIKLISELINIAVIFISLSVSLFLNKFKKLNYINLIK